MTAEIKTYWLTVDLDESFSDGSSRYGMSAEESTMKRRADSSLAHAEYRLANCSNRYDLIDGILALKRSMQTRLEHLEMLYGLKQYPQARSGGWLAVLEGWGVIRRRMLQRMNRLRNAVEHDGAEPPSKDEFEDYCEVVWWFLRATTSLLTPHEELGLVLRSGEQHCFKLQFNPVEIDLRAFALAENVCDSPVPGWHKIEATLENVMPGRDEYLYQPLPPGVFEVNTKIVDPVFAEMFVKASLAETM
ncbi:hypothetical protein ACT1U9_22405 [Streptomyces sp. BR1]|uniref:hypothetical protein n=1 Tax=Streptomyces sp. BR1 TaxID=1592323 RepID=UPI00402B9FBF